MCGFAGFINLNHQADPRSHRYRRTWLQAMGQQLTRRGPDDEQLWLDEYLAFTFRTCSDAEIVLHLYYSQTDTRLIFGSELKALLAHPQCPKQPNWYDLKTPILRSSYVNDIDMLPGGHYLLYDLAIRTVAPLCYWLIEQHFLRIARTLVSLLKVMLGSMANCLQIVCGSD